MIRDTNERKQKTKAVYDESEQKRLAESEKHRSKNVTSGNNILGFSLANGVSWRIATDEEKQSLCGRFAAASARGNPAAFFYNGLNAMYNTTDEQILQIRLADAAQLLESGSATLP